MKKIIIFTILLGTILPAWSQDPVDSWKVKMNNKTLINTSEENAVVNTRKIKPLDWKKNGWLEIHYKEADPGAWKRFFLFNDEADNQLLTLDSAKATRIRLASLRRLFAGKKEIRIYTIVSPLDPHIAVKLRRIHLCTLRNQ